MTARIRTVVQGGLLCQNEQTKETLLPTQRTCYSADLKAKLVLEVLKGNRTLSEFASEAKVHPNLLMQ